MGARKKPASRDPAEVVVKVVVGGKPGPHLWRHGIAFAPADAPSVVLPEADGKAATFRLLDAYKLATGGWAFGAVEGEGPRPRKVLLSLRSDDPAAVEEVGLEMLAQAIDEAARIRMEWRLKPDAMPKRKAGRPPSAEVDNRMKWVAGFTNTGTPDQEIARSLGISVHLVRKDRERARAKGYTLTTPKKGRGPKK